ncbi:hypothetical protein MJT46_006392 [Ovis ammon polii x Ovis aries]|nr:hypothetical protein MJT46_006392 [Ovis ammon polii x Ovis aries]
MGAPEPSVDKSIRQALTARISAPSQKSSKSVTKPSALSLLRLRAAVEASSEDEEWTGRCAFPGRFEVRIAAPSKGLSSSPVKSGWFSVNRQAGFTWSLPFTASTCPLHDAQAEKLAMYNQSYRRCPPPYEPPSHNWTQTAPPSARNRPDRPACVAHLRLLLTFVSGPVKRQLPGCSVSCANRMHVFVCRVAPGLQRLHQND